MKARLMGLMAFVMCAFAGLTSCSDDDDDYSNDKLVGLWELNAEIDWSEDYDEGAFNPNAWESITEDFIRIEFRSDGSGTTWSKQYSSSDWVKDEDFKYELKGDELRLSGPYVIMDGDAAKVLNLDDNQLVLEYSGTENGARYIYRSRFNRMN